MPSFEYEATDKNGQRVKSTAFGRNLQEVILALSNQGLQVQRIEDAYAKADSMRAPLQAAVAGAGESYMPIAMPIPEAAPTDRDAPSEVPAAPVAPSPGALREKPNVEERPAYITRVFGPLVGKVPLKDLSFFFRQFGTMIAAGVPMVQTLDTLSGQTRQRKLGKIILEMRNAVDAGLPPSSIMQRYPEVFQSLAVSLVRAGEEGGFLAESCKHVSDYLNHDIELKNMYRRETAMSKLYVVASIGIIGITNIILSSLATQIRLIAPLNAASTWVWLAPLIIGIFLFKTVGLANPTIRLVWDTVILRVPYVGKTMHHFAMAKFGRAFSALYKGGVPVSKALYLSADSAGNEHIRSQIYPAVEKIQDGEGIAATLAQTGVFSPIVMNMMATGESTGNMDQMILKAAEFYEDEGKVRAKQMAVFVGVMVGLLVGVYIGYVVITFWVQVYGGIIKEAENDTWLTGPFLAWFRT